MVRTKKQKLSMQLRPHQHSGNTATTASTKPPCSASPSSTVPRVPNIPDLTNLAFEHYKAFSLNSTQQHELIGQIRSELPVMEVYEIDSWLLNSLAKQLEICIFPTAKMMHIDPTAVKHMLDTEFRKAYGQDVEASIADQERRREKQWESAEQTDN